MSKIDQDTVDRIAHLARLEFESEEKNRILEDMNRMLDFVDKLSELNTEHIEPLIYMSDEVNQLRDDVAKETITQKEALLNAPQKDSDYIKVPKVVDRGRSEA
jgi:aspartyl-tRNA(Asn)/glutamyl-tRNA(Gln) amidotransferase subunit C